MNKTVTIPFHIVLKYVFYSNMFNLSHKHKTSKSKMSIFFFFIVLEKKQ